MTGRGSAGDWRGHVVHVVRSDGFSGVERYMCDVAPLLAARGWQVTVIGGDPDRMTERLGPLAWRPSVTTRECVRELRGIGRVDVVHSHMSAADTASALARPFTRARLVSTRHFAGRRGSHPAVRRAMALVDRSMAVDVAISSFVAAQCEPGLVVLHNGVATQPLPDPAARQRAVLVLQRLESEKDTACALRGWAASGLAMQGWELWIAGRGSEQPALQQLATTLGVGDSIRWLGFVSAPAALQATAAMLLATATAEPFGLSVAESMALALPVVASRAGAHPELLGEAGTWFEAGDATGAAAALTALAGDPEHRRNLGLALAARQQDSFSLDTHVDGLERIYAPGDVPAATSRIAAST